MSEKLNIDGFLDFDGAQEPAIYLQSPPWYPPPTCTSLDICKKVITITYMVKVEDPGNKIDGEGEFPFSCNSFNLISNIVLKLNTRKQ